MVSAMPQQFYPQEGPRHLFQQAGWAQTQSVWVLVKRNPLPLQGIEPWTVHPIASHYTNYAILAPSKLSILHTIQQGWSFTQAVEATLKRATYDP